MDNIRIDNPDLSGYLFHYQTATRTLCDDATRRDKMGDVVVWPSSTRDISYTEQENEIVEVKEVTDRDGNITTNYQAGADFIPFKTSKTYDRITESLQFEDNIASPLITVPCGWEGVFPIGNQCPTLRSMTKVKTQNNFLHPGVSVTIKLHLRKPLWQIFERYNSKDGEIFGETAAFDTDTFKDSLKVWIAGMSLTYESVIIDNPDLLARMEKQLKYIVDVPIMHLTAITPRNTFGSKTVHVVKGSKLIIISFVHENQITDQNLENSYMTSRCKFPKGLEDLQFKMPGLQGLL